MLFNLSLDRLYDIIENFNSLIKEYNDIIASNGRITIELVESNYRFEDDYIIVFFN